MTKNKTLTLERLDSVRNILRERHVARIDELCEQLGVSPATVRRDLDELQRLGEIRRVHGGAVLVGQRREEPLFDDKTAVAREEKLRIAKKAFALIEPRDTIYLDGGSTVLELARLLRDRNNITVLTNSLRAAFELAGRGPEMILVGGTFRRLSQTTVGPLTRHLLQTLHVDKAFMGTMGLDLAAGLTTSDTEEAYTKILVSEQAREVILLADSSKMGMVQFAHAGRITDIDTLVTDDDIDESITTHLENQGVNVLVV